MSFMEISNTDNLYTVFTKKKCSYCDKIKTLMVESGEMVKFVECDVLLNRNKILFLNFMKTKIQRDNITFPIVFYEGNYVGGCDDYEKELQRRILYDMTDLSFSN